MSNFSHDEQMMLMSFWCLAPSPLMLGGNLPENTRWDLGLISNDEVLAVDQDPLVKPATRVSQQGPAARDLWQHKNLGTFDTKPALSVPAHGSVLLKLSPTSKGKDEH